MRRKPGRRMKDMAKRGMVGLLTVSMCLSHVQGIAFADNRVEVGEVEVDGQKITLSLRGDSIMDAAKAAFEDAHLYEDEYLGVSRDAKTQAAYRALTDGTNPLYEMNLFSEEEMQALEDAGVEVKALIQMDQEQAEAEGNLKPATESNALRATEEENTQLVVFDPKKEGKKDMLLYKQDSLFANFYDQFSNQLMNQTTTEITAADPASYEINGDEKVTFILINHADDSRVLNLKLNDATLEKSIKLPKAETVITGVMHTLDEKGIDDTTESANPSVVPTQEATTADSTTADANASTEASTEAAATTDAAGANAETQFPAESETTAAATETLPQEGQIESENIKSEATEAAPEHKTLAETVKKALAQAVETVKETITAVEETFGVIHSEAAENEGFATESELEKGTTAAAAEEKKENVKTEMDTALENERKDLLKNTKASELVDSSVASAKVLQYTLDDLSKAYWSAEIEGEYEVNVFAEKTAFDADDHVKLQLKKLDKPEEAEDGTLATSDDTLSKEQVDALKADGSYENSQSIDIRFVDEDGKEVEPKTPVKVKIKVYKDALPEDADISTMTIKHLDESTGSVQADTVASYGDAANGAIKAVDEQGKKVELKSVDADTTEAADEKVEAASVAATTTKEVLPEEAVGVESTFTVKSFSSFTITFGTATATVKFVCDYGNYHEWIEPNATLKDVTSSGSDSEITEFDFSKYAAGYRWNRAFTFEKVKLVPNKGGYNENGITINNILKKVKDAKDNDAWQYTWTSGDDSEHEGFVRNNDIIYVVYTSGAKLTEVDTVSNKDLGLHLYMTDFDNNVGDKCRFGGGEYWDHNGKLTQGIYSSIIPEGREFPTLTDQAYKVSGWKNGDNNGTALSGGSLDGTSIEKWCGKQKDGAGNVTNEVDGLFLKSRYDEDGYFYYNSADNFATLIDDNGNTTNSFRVYNQLGTPGGDNDGSFFYQRGNFMPYNRLDITKKRNVNRFDYKANKLQPNDPRINEPLYGFIEDSNNFYFGMYGYANFYQPEDGKVNGENMVYRFTGDDDLVVYVDDVLVLDLGGIHEAQSGSIDFTTGDIQYTNYSSDNKDRTVVNTTIKKQFLAAYQNADEDTKTKINNLWQPDTKGTFKYGTKHTIKFFYMERGAGASNLRLEMNIQPIPTGSLTVQKKVDDLNPEQAKNETFKFQLLKKDDNNETPLRNEIYTVGAGKDAVHYTNKDGIFTLKGNESAVFTQIEANTTVKVVEQGIDSNSKYEDPSYAATDKEGKVEQSNSVTMPDKEENKDVRIEVTNTLKSPKSLSITKKFNVDGNEGDKILAPDMDSTQGFKNAEFILQEYETTTKKYETLRSVHYSEFNRETGTYTFTKLDPTKTYKVVENISKGDPSETNPNGGTTGQVAYQKTSYKIGNAAVVNDGNAAEGIKFENENENGNTVTFTNYYGSSIVQFLKVDMDHPSKKLSGAKFRLTKDGTPYTDASAGMKADGTTPLLNSDGEFEIADAESGITLKLPAGKYQLTEVLAPNGYNLLTQTIDFTISGGEVTRNGTNNMFTISETTDESTDKFVVTIMNKAGVALPVTGGTGTILFSLGGMALMLIALGYVVMKRREEGVVIK